MGRADNHQTEPTTPLSVPFFRSYNAHTPDQPSVGQRKWRTRSSSCQPGDSFLNPWLRCFIHSVASWSQWVLLEKLLWKTWKLMSRLFVNTPLGFLIVRSKIGNSNREIEVESLLSLGLLIIRLKWKFLYNPLEINGRIYFRCCIFGLPF